MFAQPVNGSANTKVAPGPSMAPRSPVAACCELGAPTTTALPLIATELPKLKYVMPPDGESLAIGCAFFQPVLGSVKTYAAGEPLVNPTSPSKTGDPTTIVLPLIATAAPKLKLSSGGVKMAVWVMFFQPVLGSVKT